MIKLLAVGIREMDLHCRRCRQRAQFKVLFAPCEDKCGGTHPSAKHVGTQLMQIWWRSHAEPHALVSVYDDEVVVDDE